VPAGTDASRLKVANAPRMRAGQGGEQPAASSAARRPYSRPAVAERR